MSSATRSHSRGVVCFSDVQNVLIDKLRRGRSIPANCANGHPLKPESLQIDQEGRWRCRQCGRERGALFRRRKQTAA